MTPEPAKDQATAARAPCPNAAKTVTCEHCVEFLLDYFDGLLPESQRFAFESHVAFCKECEIYLNNYRAAAALTQCLGREARAAGLFAVPETLVAAILQARKQAGGISVRRDTDQADSASV